MAEVNTTETALAKREIPQRRQSLQRRENALPIHASYYQQLQKVRLTKRDKRFTVYIFYIISSALLLLTHAFTTWRFSRIAQARAALGQQYLRPESNLFAAFLIVSICIGLYAFLASFYRQVSTEYFISTCVIILAAAPAFLAIELYGMYQFQVERQAIDTKFFMQLVKSEIENGLIEEDLETSLPSLSSQIPELASSFGQIRHVAITTKSEVLLSCSRTQCRDVADKQNYQLAFDFCRTAKYRELLVNKEEEGIGQICVTLQ